MINIVNELEKKNLENITKIKKWTRNCPKCNSIIKYLSNDKLKRAIKQNSRCRKCASLDLKIKLTKYNDNYSLIRICFVCKNEIKYKNKYNFLSANKKNTICKMCRFNENRNDMTGKCHSVESKNKISEKLKGKNTWSKGKSLANLHKLKISKSNKGHIVSTITKQKMSLSARGKNTWSKGRHHTNEYKKLMRQKAIDRMFLLGIKSCEDKGAREYFNKLNLDLGYNFKINFHLKDLGYFADAYDRNNHVWAEYDTKYHNYYKQKEKDIIRQNNIIEYFKSIGNPLNKFIRINSENNTIYTVYENKQ